MNKPTPTCHWDRQAEEHRTLEHQPDCTDRHCPGCVTCTHDDDGNPARHCRIRLRCTSHLTTGEHACPQCLGRVRRNLSRILDLMALMPAEALHAGIESEATNLAGPHANPLELKDRFLALLAAGIDVEDLDDTDPHQALSVYERLIREHLTHDTTTVVSPTLSGTVGYLDWVLTDLARDETQVRTLTGLLALTHRLVAHLESVRHDEAGNERGAACPLCATPAPELQRRWAHWCEDPDCEKEHDKSGARDTWQCPANPDHWWREAEYRLRIANDYLDHSPFLTARDITNAWGVQPGTLRQWAARGQINRKRGIDGTWEYDVDRALELQKSTDTKATG